MLEASEAAAVEEVNAWATGLDALHAGIVGRFVRSEPRLICAGCSAMGARKNGWQLAKHAGERTPDGMQRLPATADWDPTGSATTCAPVVEHLGEEGAVLVVDEDKLGVQADTPRVPGTLTGRHAPLAAVNDAPGLGDQSGVRLVHPAP